MALGVCSEVGGRGSGGLGTSLAWLAGGSEGLLAGAGPAEGLLGTAPEGV